MQRFIALRVAVDKTELQPNTVFHLAFFCTINEAVTHLYATSDFIDTLAEEYFYPPWSYHFDAVQTILSSLAPVWVHAQDGCEKGEHLQVLPMPASNIELTSFCSQFQDEL